VSEWTVTTPVLVSRNPDDVHKHLDLIQAVITRMSAPSIRLAGMARRQRRGLRPCTPVAGTIMNMVMGGGRSPVTCPPFGVAMGNAHLDVAAIASEVGAHHHEDGVAQILERWF